VSPAYVLRLVCLCLAAFFMVHLAVGMAVVAISPAAVRMAERMMPRAAARWLLAFRLLPPACALLVVGALCVPSYLWLEPASEGEEVGVVCLCTALLGALVWAVSIARGVAAVSRSLRFVRRCKHTGSETLLEGSESPVWVMERGNGSVILAGILRPRLFISRRVLTVLSAGQLAAAVRHEMAHRSSRDNLKRLAILLSPGLCPFFRGFESLEAHWTRFTEWAADDLAVEGNWRRSLSLAAALVRVARLGPAINPAGAAAPLLGEGGDLAARVERLLRGGTVAGESGRAKPAIAATAAAALSMLLVAGMLQPATLQAAHRLFEALMR